MKKIIVRYKLEINNDVQKIYMRKNSRVICLKVFDSAVYIWVEEIEEVNSTLIARFFKLYSGGHAIEVADNYFGTIFLGVFAWHLYEKYLNEDEETITQKEVP